MSNMTQAKLRTPNPPRNRFSLQGSLSQKKLHSLSCCIFQRPWGLFQHFLLLSHWHLYHHVLLSFYFTWVCFSPSHIYPQSRQPLSPGLLQKPSHWTLPHPYFFLPQSIHYTAARDTGIMWIHTLVKPFIWPPTILGYRPCFSAETVKQCWNWKSAAATSHMWPFTFKLIKMKWKQKFSSLVVPATFQELRSKT